MPIRCLVRACESLFESRPYCSSLRLPPLALLIATISLMAVVLLIEDSMMVRLFVTALKP